MKILPKLILLILVSSITHLNVYADEPLKCGKEWINIHKNNPDLIGIHVQQLPDCIGDREEDYKGQHPVMIIYIFKGGRAHTVFYTPSGQVTDGYWGDTPHWALKLLVKDLKLDVRCTY